MTAVMAGPGAPPPAATGPVNAVAAAPAPDADDRSRLPLDARDVTVRFGGLTALDRVSIEVRPGEIVGLIGGNGAGKTTFMNCVSGYVEPDRGAELRAFGQELLGLAPEHRPYAEVGRSYQAATLFPGLTVTETLLVAVERHNPTGVLGAIVGSSRARRTERAKRQQVDGLIGATGLDPYRERLVSELSTGTRRVVDIACILAQRPGLLLLDEPTGGLAQRETEAFAPLIRGVQAELGCAVLVIEHDMVMIGEICDRVYALETGSVIAEGTADEVRNDPAVIASYLGTDEVAIARSGSAVAPVPEPRRDERRPHRTSHRRVPLVAPPDFGALRRDELLDLAARAGVTGRRTMRKADLVDALVAHHRHHHRAVGR